MNKIVAIVGRPNVGKSTLLIAYLKAIKRLLIPTVELQEIVTIQYQTGMVKLLQLLILGATLEEVVTTMKKRLMIK